MAGVNCAYKCVVYGEVQLPDLCITHRFLVTHKFTEKKNPGQLRCKRYIGDWLSSMAYFWHYDILMTGRANVNMTGGVLGVNGFVKTDGAHFADKHAWLRHEASF